MLGAIIGDIVGSRFEFNNHRSKEFDLFSEDCYVTDDSVMTLAIAKAIMEATNNKTPNIRGYDDGFNASLSGLAVKYMQEIGRKYPNCGFGGMFSQWVFSMNPEPYNSFGNGAAMRVSPAGFAARDEWEAVELAEIVTEVTHNHDEGIKGAQATALAVCMARQGALKSEIRKRIERDYYPLDFFIDDIRSTYRFNETCQETVPQAIKCFLESTSFEDAIRIAISLGGDSDTIAAIVGAIAAAYYGIPDVIKETALSYLDSELRAIYDEWEAFAGEKYEQFRVITKYICRISDTLSINGTIEKGMDYFPYWEFEQEWIYSGLPCTEYGDVLAEMGVPLDSKRIIEKEVSTLGSEQVLALITAAFRDDHFSNGALLEYLNCGAILKWLKRLKDIDWEDREIIKIELQIGGYFAGYSFYRLVFKPDGAELSENEMYSNEADKVRHFTLTASEALKKRLSTIHTEYWSVDYLDPWVLDGEQWTLFIYYTDGCALKYSGSNAYPDNWNDLLEAFGIEGRYG